MCWNLPMRCGHKMVMQLGWLQIFWNQPGYLNWEKMIKQVCEGQLWDQRLRGGLKGAFARSAPGSSCCLPRAAGWDAESSVTSHLPEATGQGGPYYWSARRDTGIKKKQKLFWSSLETEADDTALPHITLKISSVKMSRSNKMIKDPCLYSDSNLLPVLQFLPLMSRHKETERLGWLPRRQ